ncbi:MAG: hypothetical protein WBX01_03620 [Nitrososphaeraceae archaeon]|jgi:hypothetical protein
MSGEDISIDFIPPVEDEDISIGIIIPPPSLLIESDGREITPVEDIMPNTIKPIPAILAM